MSRDSSRRRIWVVGLALAVALVPALAFAAHPAGDFEDVPEDHTFHDDIQWMHDNGITRGCNPPENDEYCPDRELIRAEEAAFFHRYDNFLRNDLEPRLVPADCEEGQIAEWNGENWQCADRTDIAPPDDGLTVSSGEATPVPGDGTPTEVTAECDTEQAAFAGTITPVQENVTIDAEIVSGSTYTATVVNTTGDEVDVTAHAVCTSA